jgi:ribonuclease Z
MNRWGIVVLAVVITLGGIALFILATERGQDMALARLVNTAMQAGDDTATYDGLRVFVCGSSSPLPAPDRAQACIAVSAGDRLYLVDAGAGSAAVARLGRLPLQNLRAVLLTHFHSDHIAAIPDFNLNSWVAGRPQPLDIIGPVGVDGVVEGLNDAYALDRGYRVAHHGDALLPPELGEMRPVTIRPGVILDEDALVIKAFVVDHAPVKPAVGYRFDYHGRSVVVSGDSIVTESLRIAAKDADLLLHDALSMPIIQALAKGAAAAGRDRQAKILGDIQGYHAHTTDLVDLARRANVRQLVLYHLVPAPQNLLFEQIFRRGLPSQVVLAEDGMVFELPSNSQAIIMD